MLVVHIIGFASIWSIFQRSFFLHPLASFDLVQTTDELLYICVGMAISTAAILLKGKSVLSRNRQWLKVALAATAMGLIGGGVLVYCNEAALAPPALFAEAFCIVMGASSILSLYLWSVELIRYAYQTSFGWAVFSFFSAVFLARAATALVGNSLLGTLQILFSCPTSLALWALSAHASTIEVLAISSFEISRSERRFLIASIVLMLTMPLSHILLIGIPSFAEMSFSNDTRSSRDFPLRRHSCRRALLQCCKSHNRPTSLVCALRCDRRNVSRTPLKQLKRRLYRFCRHQHHQYSVVTLLHAALLLAPALLLRVLSQPCPYFRPHVLRAPVHRYSHQAFRIYRRRAAPHSSVNSRPGSPYRSSRCWPCLCFLLPLARATHSRPSSIPTPSSKPPLSARLTRGRNAL